MTILISNIVWSKSFITVLLIFFFEPSVLLILFRVSILKNKEDSFKIVNHLIKLHENLELWDNSNLRWVSICNVFLVAMNTSSTNQRGKTSFAVHGTFSRKTFSTKMLMEKVKPNQGFWPYLHKSELRNGMCSGTKLNK
jgi:hypothetical protein